MCDGSYLFIGDRCSAKCNMAVGHDSVINDICHDANSDYFFKVTKYLIIRIKITQKIYAIVCK